MPTECQSCFSTGVRERGPHHGSQLQLPSRNAMRSRGKRESTPPVTAAPSVSIISTG